MWQACPLCGGSGMTGVYGNPCPVCHGKMIISDVDGKPPKDVLTGG